MGRGEMGTGEPWNWWEPKFRGKWRPEFPAYDYEIELLGPVPSKKNSYTPRKDRPGVFKNSKLRAELDRLQIQIPGYVRDLKLVSPDIEIEMQVPNGRRDRDGALTTILDLLVSTGVLKNDSAAQCNGLVTLLPVTFGPDWRTIIRLGKRDT